MDAFIDTNLLKKFVFPRRDDKAERQLIREVLRNYDIQHNVVSLVEAARDGRLNDFQRRKLHQLLGQTPCVPDQSEWRSAHYMLVEWAQSRQRKDKHAMRKMQMDCLIAAMAVKRGCAVVTRDKDFKELQRTREGKPLIVWFDSA